MLQKRLTQPAHAHIICACLYGLRMLLFVFIEVFSKTINFVIY